MRELQIEYADLPKSFADIEELIRNCRFADCSHQSEPGCAVKEAILNGTLTAELLASYHKLQIEEKTNGDVTFWGYERPYMSYLQTVKLP
ncbi:MAG: hypothetical protein ACRDBM_07965 [Sporomusa sp.]